MLSVFNVTSSYKQMRTSDFIGPLDYFISILVMMFIVAELLICEVGCYVEERECFSELFGELLHI